MRARSLVPLMASFVLGSLTSAAVASHLPDVYGLLSDARRDVRAIDRLAYQSPDPRLRDALRAHTARLDGTLRAVEGALGPPMQPQPPPPPPGPPITGDAELSGMLGALANEPFDRDKLALLGDMARGRLFTSAQVARVMAAFTFDDQKVDAASMLYPQVVDPQNFWSVYGGLTFTSSRDELRRRVAAQPQRW